MSPSARRGVRTEVFTASDGEAAIRVIPEHRGPGRPSTGVRVDIRIPADVLRLVDSYAKVYDVKRAEAIRRLIDLGITQAMMTGRHQC